MLPKKWVQKLLMFCWHSFSEVPQVPGDQPSPNSFSAKGQVLPGERPPEPEQINVKPFRMPSSHNYLTKQRQRYVSIIPSTGQLGLATDPAEPLPCKYSINAVNADQPISLTLLKHPVTKGT